MVSFAYEAELTYSPYLNGVAKSLKRVESEPHSLPTSLLGEAARRSHPGSEAETSNG